MRVPDGRRRYRTGNQGYNKMKNQFERFYKNLISLVKFWNDALKKIQMEKKIFGIGIKSKNKN